MPTPTIRPGPTPRSTPRTPPRAARTPGYGALACLGLLLVACQGSGARIDRETQLELYRETALDHYDQGDLNRAESQALKGLHLEKDDKVLRLMIGWICLRRGDVANLERAEWVFRGFLRDHPKEQRATLGLASALERLGGANLAAATAIESGDRLPDRGRPEVRARELRQTAEENWEEALELYQQNLAAGGGSLDAVDGMQRVTARLGRYEESLQWSERLVDQAERERQWYRSKLETAQVTAVEERRLREGERRARRLLVDTFLAANALHVSAGQWQPAVAALDAALALEPEDPNLYSRRAQLRYLLGDFEGALVDIDRFVASSPLATNHPDIQTAFRLRDFASRADDSLDFDLTSTAVAAR
jgi:tetratricopeptide (TPR) repeat protein